MNTPLPADLLRLDQQLCFPLYAASRLVTRLYQPLLEPLGLTYPQYIVLMILWEESPCSVSRIGERALLASNTLTPLLKRLEQQGLIVRTRSAQDERVVNIALTEAGQALRAGCACVPLRLFEQIGYPVDEALELKQHLDTLLARLLQLSPEQG
ncbi:MAG: MarR family transcriptional regulator [Candidatus Dactylopiibacterium carminicum]|uniref:MarR family transcriptional regulator n=1 Tax=Candidatus Dactylopiibacterium carminicum TaxID=857335 RepID=A0A272ERQ1_9RHOO|nr:MarR family transcriptional regulator [Candidatus Dactylopiibacterium carminicum]KAF7598856.1 MarR family transcriptional regulator [Candidatus Dactylopiibacterium carminicum]PAS92772.1 MAG: MarR family transcriptional regulator [Candidatus Dactylopiibacterium carminicum]PAS96222.1 MAG: MarR family transcriptional regulator [Candidatus Dactylopiibacterium carminicum]PAS98873.1 MAG: MarR family transcriptional regulator [Candidatus Dactylopiibacterium carminicum]